MAAAPGGPLRSAGPARADAVASALGHRPRPAARHRHDTTPAGFGPGRLVRAAAAHLRPPRPARRLPAVRAEEETRRPGRARPRQRRSAASLLLPPPHARARRRHPAGARDPRLRAPPRAHSWGSAAANQRAPARAPPLPSPYPPPPPPSTGAPPYSPSRKRHHPGVHTLSAAPPRCDPPGPLPPAHRTHRLGLAHMAAHPAPHPRARYPHLKQWWGHRASGTGRDGAAGQCLTCRPRCPSRPLPSPPSVSPPGRPRGR
ncbi:splicing factor 3A subunit 2-like [Pezoporus occidentalis]|uniref:splicing factor 3A subunit 2-like n=1 Tax=Pezoporus occidentalis TaxID=407982 RepID=UPI002F9113A0